MQDCLFEFTNPLDERLGRPFFSDLPKDPGIYKMYGDDDSLLYVGKAKNLKLRLQSYRRVKIGHTSSKTLRLVHQVNRISWETCASEELALVRENELLRTIKPPFNVVNTTPEKYFYFKVNVLSELTHSNLVPLELSLTLNGEETGQLFGAFKGMSLCQKTFFALRRLLWVVEQEPDAFHAHFAYPLFLYKRQRVHPHTFALSRYWLNELSGFLNGFGGAKMKSMPLADPLAEVISHLRDCDAFHQAWFQTDLETLRRFYRSASAKNRHLKKNFKGDSPTIFQTSLDDLISTQKFRDSY